MKFCLYIGNHNKIKGIEDYIYSIENIFLKKNIKIEVVRNLSKDFDFIFIIENFTDNRNEFNDKLFNLKNSGKKLCLIHTEFLVKNGYFNLFTRRDLIYRKLILDNIFNNLYKNKNNYIYKLFLYIFYFFYTLIGFLFGFKFRDIKKRVYFALRDIAYKESYEIFDYHIALGDNIYKNLKKNATLKNLFYLQPFIDKEYTNKIKSRNDLIEIFYLSGYKTHFRKRIVEGIVNRGFAEFYDKNNISKLNFTNAFCNLRKKSILIYSDESLVKKIFLEYKNKKDLKPYGFELYISQREGWMFLSPMRTIRSIRNYSIPINIGIYKNSNIRKLAINVENIDKLVENKKQLLEKYLKVIEFNVKNFNEYSSYKLSIFFEKLKLD